MVGICSMTVSKVNNILQLSRTKLRMYIHVCILTMYVENRAYANVKLHHNYNKDNNYT